MPLQHLINGPENASICLALAHGAGAPMDSNFMNKFAENIGAEGFRVLRFEFPYMIERRKTGKKKPPDRTPVLLNAWHEIIDMVGSQNLVIGGKSMGGRIASMVADEVKVRGLICLGYPFHGPGKALNKGRIEHLLHLKTPSLFCQGTRDNLGNISEVNDYTLSKAITFHWLKDGDHSFKPRKTSGISESENWDSAIKVIIKFLKAV
mgnify:CR=1 FL=1